MSASRLLNLSSRRTVKIRGRQLQLCNFFFDTPVQQERRLPRRADLTGLKVWPTALRILDEVAETLIPSLRARAEAQQRPLRVLELGSGTGALGLGVALIVGGPSHVIVTDPNLPVNFTEEQSGSSLEWLQTNVEINQDVTSAAGALVEARELEWANDAHLDALLAECSQRNGHGDSGGFDLVLGSEILYDPDQYSHLHKVLRRVAACSDEEAVTVLGYTLRHGAEARFLAESRRHFGAVDTQRYERTDATSAWELTTLREPIIQHSHEP
jgi:predicted nicotinamide N-methyase